MPIESDGSKVTKRTIGALLLLASFNATLQAYGTLNSSPWTSENFGASPEKARSSRWYVTNAVLLSMGYAVASAFIAESALPVIGAALTNAYLVFIYERALRKGSSAGSEDWGQ